MDSIPTEWWKRAADLVPYGVCCIDLDNRVVYANHAYCTTVGYSQAELVGRTLMSITEDCDVGGNLKSFEDLKKSESRESYSHQIRYKHRDGHLVAVQSLIHSFHDEGRLSLFIACMGPVMTTADFFERYESKMKQELDQIRDELRRVQEERAFRLAVFKFIKEWWVLVAGITSMIAGAIWNIAKD